MTKETQGYSSKLPKINDLLDTLKIEANEDGYREKLSKLDSNDLEQLAKLDKDKLKTLLEKSQLEIQQYLIQTQIDELENKGFKNLSRAEKIKYDTLSDKLIAVENQKQEKQKITIAEEKSETKLKETKTSENNKLIAKEKQETSAKSKMIENNQEYLKTQEQIKEQLTSIKGSLDNLS